MASEIQRNDIAGAARGLARMPSVAQPPLASNGAHSVPASSTMAGCAHEFAGEQEGAGASRQPAVLAEPSEPASQATGPLTASPAIQPVIQEPGTIILDLLDLPDLNDAARRAVAADRVIELMSQICPQGEDCAGPPDNRDNNSGGCRVYECDECDFRGCASCMEIHESEPHWSDGAAMRERHAGDRANW